MIHFFRRFRQQLLNENKTGKYLKYAIGEILLVVIGILIALILNSRIAHITSVKAANNSVVNLRHDIEKDLMQLDDFWFPRIENQFKARARLTVFLENNLAPIEDSLQFATDVQTISTYYTFDPNKSAIEDLFNTNGLKLIENQRLLRSLLDYKRKVENVIDSDVIQRAHFLDLYTQLSVNIVDGLALQELLMFDNEFDEIKIKQRLNNALNADEIRSSDYLRKLLISTYLPLFTKRRGYRDLRKHADSLLYIIDEIVNSNISGK